MSETERGDSAQQPRGTGGFFQGHVESLAQKPNDFQNFGQSCFTFDLGSN